MSAGCRRRGAGAEMAGSVPAAAPAPVVMRVGLTGGIGSGKSEVSRRLVAYGAVLIDADAIAREGVAPGTAGLGQGGAEIVPGMPAPHGSLDRDRLGEIVFADAGQRARLN